MVVKGSRIYSVTSLVAFDLDRELSFDVVQYYKSLICTIYLCSLSLTIILDNVMSCVEHGCVVSYKDFCVVWLNFGTIKITRKVQSLKIDGEQEV